MTPRLVLVVASLVGCQQNKPAPPPTPRPTPVADAQPKADLVPIEKVPGLEFPRYDKSQRDCRPSETVRRHFAGTLVKPCGAYTWHESRADDRKDAGVANACIEAAIAAKQPFVAEKRFRGTDSAVGRGLVAIVEQGKLVIYAASYDSDPCGGSCSQSGHTDIRRCTDFSLAGCDDPLECFRCDGDPISSVVERCVYVSPRPACKIDEAAMQACEAKGPGFAYTFPPHRWCGRRPSAAEEEAQRKASVNAPCECVDLVTDRDNAKKCAAIPRMHPK